MIGTAQGTVIAKIGVPSFVVTLAGLLIWQGVILKVLELRGVIIIETDWINYAATYYFSANVGWLIAAIITGAYALVELGGADRPATRGSVGQTVDAGHRSSRASLWRASALSRSATTRRSRRRARRARRSQ